MRIHVLLKQDGDTSKTCILPASMASMTTAAAAAAIVAVTAAAAAIVTVTAAITFVIRTSLRIKFEACGIRVDAHGLGVVGRKDLAAESAHGVLGQCHGEGANSGGHHCQLTGGSVVGSDGVNQWLRSIGNRNTAIDDNAIQQKQLERVHGIGRRGCGGHDVQGVVDIVGRSQTADEHEVTDLRRANGRVGDKGLEGRRG